MKKQKVVLKRKHAPRAGRTDFRHGSRIMPAIDESLESLYPRREHEDMTLAGELGRAAFPSLQLAHPLEAVFRDAVDQARKGKGDARHGHGREFMKQTWLETANAHGAGFLTGQAEKKLRESLKLEYAQRRTERLGALVYLAMAIIQDDIANGVNGKSAS